MLDRQFFSLSEAATKGPIPICPLLLYQNPSPKESAEGADATKRAIVIFSGCRAASVHKSIR